MTWHENNRSYSSSRSWQWHLIIIRTRDLWLRALGLVNLSFNKIKSPLSPACKVNSDLYFNLYIYSPPFSYLSLLLTRRKTFPSTHPASNPPHGLLVPLTMAGVRLEKNTKGSWRKTISIALTSIMEMWKLCDPLGWVSAFQKVLQACEESPQSDLVLPTPRFCKLTRSVAHILHKLHNLRFKKRGDGSWGVSGFICLQPACSTLDTDPGYATPTFTHPPPCPLRHQATRCSRTRDINGRWWRAWHNNGLATAHRWDDKQLLKSRTNSPSFP